MSNFPLPYSSLKRSTKPIRAKKKLLVRIGKVSGKVRLSGAAMEALRVERYKLDGGRCTWHKGKKDECGVWLPLYASVFNRAHLAHIIARSIGGSDTIANTTIRCFHHHIGVEHTTGEKG